MGHVTFGKTFAVTPTVIVSPMTSGPQNVFVGYTKLTKSGFDAVLVRNSIVETWVYWVAILDRG